MKKVKRLLIGAGIFLIVAVFSILGVLTWAFYHPRETFEMTQKYFLPNDLNITWEKMEFSAERLGFLNYKFDLSTQGISIQKTQPHMSIPVQNLRVQASVAPFSLGPQLYVHQLQVQATEPILVKTSQQKSSEKQRSPFQILQSLLNSLRTLHDHVQIENPNVQVDSVQIFSGEGEPITLRLQSEPTSEINKLPVQLTVQKNGEAGFTLKTQAKVDLNALENDKNILEMQLEFQGWNWNVKQNLSLTTTEEKALLKSQGPIQYSKDSLKLLIQPTTQIHMDEEEALLQITGGVQGIPGPLAKVDSLQVKFRSPLEEDKMWSENKSTFEISAPIDLFFVDKVMRASLEKGCECRLPEALKAQAKGHVWLEKVLGDLKKKEPVLELSLNVESLQNKILDMRLAAQLKMEKQGKTFFYYPTLDSTIHFQSFQSLQKILESKKVLIPAPFSVLDGEILLRAHGPLERNEKQSEFPLEAHVDLKSAKQKVKLDSVAKVVVNPTFDDFFFDVLLKIQDLQLELPPLDPLKGLPRVTKDNRIALVPAKKQKSHLKFSFSFQVETVNPGGIQLFAKYFEPSIPLTLNVHSQGVRDNAGYIKAEPFKISYLRRVVSVERLQVSLDKTEDAIFPIHGRFKIKQTQYTVFIDIAGTTKNPQIKMSSDPYLPESEIISVLLYDRTSDQLVSADAETAGSVQAAVADRAIGIFGLWAFAATPIKSFSYNPVTKIYAATLAVTDDLTASVGTNWEETTHLELRKRVSRRWMLTAAWTPATQEEPQSSKLVLQWENRF